MAKVAIVMGSDSDLPVMSKAADFLEEIGIDYEMTIISAHREPDIFFEWAKGAEERGVKVIIAGAGKAAHLPGMCAALFPMPVIGIPMKTSFGKQLREGLVTNNPIFVQFLGMCSALAITTSVTNAIGMGLSVTAVLICSNLLISLLRRVIMPQVRIAAFIVIIPGFVTAV